MLSEADLPLRIVERGAYFDFLGPQDEPWLRVLLAEMVRFEGRRRREMAERLAEPLPCEAPYFKRRAATRVLLRLWRRERVALVPPAQARARLFDAAAAAADFDGEAIRAAVATDFGVGEPALAESLFADLPGERVVRAPEPFPSVAEIALRTNLAVVQSALMRSSTIELHVEGGVRPIVRLAKFRGLLCSVVERAVDGAARGEPVIQISGPFSIFQHTLLYGRALAEIIPHLAWCAHFRLRAACALRGRICSVGVESGDPIFPAAAPAAFDSRLEEWFARDIQKLAPDWDLIREPEAIRAGTTLVFPDFMLRHRIHPQRRVLIEIAGFWTPEYLRGKIDRLRQADLPTFILCIDDQRACGQAELPLDLAASIVRFRRRVDAKQVMRAVERLVGGI
ncbi:MAG TPA: DUF790 family protein [Polyangia bacterium]|nr:DUF790 family protein [Polyangia bacterium]